MSAGNWKKERKEGRQERKNKRGRICKCDGVNGRNTREVIENKGEEEEIKERESEERGRIGEMWNRGIFD